MTYKEMCEVIAETANLLCGAKFTGEDVWTQNRFGELFMLNDQYDFCTAVLPRLRLKPPTVFPDPKPTKYQLASMFDQFAAAIAKGIT